MKSCLNVESKLSLECYFEACILEHGRSLFNYIYSLVRHKELAEDLYQEVLISAYLALPSFEERAKVKNWLFKIAVNKCRDYWRKEKSATRFWEEKVYLYVDDKNPMQQPEESVLHKCSQEEMVDTLQELPEMYRDPLLLFYYHHKTLVEISDKTNLPLSTVKTRMKRAKDRLRPKVEELVVNG
ncbi:RNA polymerase sigma-70 factor (ECF subfamily) [Cytobacillus eiseniae]|uniref:RNA polymerase sigma-70 factor (ECF subfamily) n=1 Tax=Cytobacillus eiseniae TaxID=762947 RepID=A0ABS4RJB5_9BACI|nr:RNA polymerase sigma factor [Cytobacillus eiseniae]MBP2241907.1 RNA polymerase sigma-70 factor (ECF subfamily) [Cytobacillus eiseniae]